MCPMKLIKVLSLVLILSEVNLSQCKTIEIDQGWLKGTEEVSEDGRTYYVFRGIPFAQPPVGELRFEPPRPLESTWEGELDATQHVPFCAQAALGYDEGQEDCLYLAVYTPKLESTGNLPVLVWLHGGAFVTGGTKEYSPHLIMDRDVVVVIPQYRLGILGFFTTHSSYAGGNYGLLDQLEALKWVNQNIAKFGGDPNRVTLGGDCAGGISSILHMMSPLSEGLFQRVMSFSGSPLSYWALSAKHNRLGLLIAKTVICPAYDHHILMKCFREKPVDQLLIAQRDILEARDLLIGNHKISPAVQIPAYTHQSTLFLDDFPLKKLMKGDYAKLPTLLSVTRDIGSYLVDMALYDFILLRQEEDPKFIEKIFMILVKEIDILDFETETEKFKRFYLPDWDNSNLEEAIPGLTEMLGDVAFNAPILTLAKMLSENTETRLLRFDYENGPKLYDLRHSRNSSMPPIEPTRVSHGDDLYFFLPNEKFEITAEDKKVVTKMLNMIEDFVYARDSLKDWPEFTANGLETRVLTGNGEIEDKIRFTNEKREKFFQYIIQEQQLRALKSIKEEAEIDLSKWMHDEL